MEKQLPRQSPDWRFRWNPEEILLEKVSRKIQIQGNL
jgi:hypothetical protein